LIGRRRSPGPTTVYFLSDYGLDDEFVGVVHAVLARRAPRARVIDLGHRVRPFDVRGAAALLERAVDHLGPGLVLAVVDPGVGGSRRAVAVEVSSTGGPRWFVGPDNGLLVGAAERVGAIARAVELARLTGAGTFDGRDVLAPAAAALCAGTPMPALGAPIEPAGLVRLRPPLLVSESDAAGRLTVLRAEVTWVDRFGNVQLAARAADLAGAPDGPSAVRVADGGAGGAGSGDLALRPIAAFSDLAQGELGLLVDANGFLALVVNRGSAADRLALRSGSHVELTW